MKPLATRLAPYEVFFPLAALGTIVAVGLTVPALHGGWTPPAGLSAADWHAHEMLFGQFPAAFAGVMLTALPRWTKGPSMTPAAVVALALLFLAARLAFLFAPDPAWLWSSPIALAGLTAHAGWRIVAAGNRRDFGLLTLLATLAVADGLFLATVRDGDAALALRLALTATVLVATVMGGRIAPALTRHLAEKRGRPRVPPTPRPLEIAVFAATVPALAVWVATPTAPATALGLGLAALLHVARLAGWKGWSTVDRPPFLALHFGYAFLPFGLAAMAVAILRGDVALVDVATHAWGVGTFGLMCAAIMTSVVRRYSGKALTVSRLADAIVGLLLLAAILRLAAAPLALPAGPLWASATVWVAAWSTLVALLTRDRRLPPPANTDASPDADESGEIG
ncbi:MAG: NnrS family protein [Siculibacillus sp.]|nr:NnrS family protein [Siculibacillus sp.]